MNNEQIIDEQINIKKQLKRAYFYSTVFALVQTILNIGTITLNLNSLLTNGATIALLLYDAINKNKLWKQTWDRNNYKQIFKNLFNIILNFGIMIVLTCIIKFFSKSLTWKFVKFIIFTIITFNLNVSGNIVVAFLILFFTFTFPIIPKISSWLTKSKK